MLYEVITRRADLSGPVRLALVLLIVQVALGDLRDLIAAPPVEER